MGNIGFTKTQKIITNQKIRSFQNGLIKWYSDAGRTFPWRDTDASVYERIIAELLLQRTKAGTIATYFPTFIKKYPSWEKIVLSSKDELEKDLKPIGLWKRRENALRELSNEMVKRHGIFPATLHEIEALPGVGQYIRNAIMIFVYGGNYPLLDINMARVLERYFHPRKLADIRDDPFLQLISYSVVQKVNPLAINWAILDVGSLFCKASKPLCTECPIKRGCNFYRGIVE